MDNNSDSEEEFNSNHSKLVKSLQETFGDEDKYKRKNNVGSWTRMEAGKEIDEFNIPSRVSERNITLDTVLDCLNQEDDDDDDDDVEGESKAKKKKNKRPKSSVSIKSKQKIKTLTKPLEKPAADKIQRKVIYENVKKDISKWNSVVYHNRTADQLVFPLSASKKLPRKTTKDAASEFVPETLLEEEMAKILHGEEFVKKRKAEIHEKDELKSDAETYVMGIEEALERHHEMARLRALQSYEQIKSKRQSKIKSKKYHRLLRRQKIRKQLKEFEELQKTDPEAALVKLEELDKSRIQERMSLKHRNTSKWAKMQSARAKYDRESRSALSDQLKISRELTKKVGMESSEDEDDDMAIDLPNLVKSSLTNPWILDPSVKDNEKVHLYYTGYKKFWQEVNEKKKKERTNKIGDADEVRDLNVDESGRNNEGEDSDDSDSDSNKVEKQKKVASEGVDLVSVRNKEVNSFGQKLRQTPKSPNKIIDPKHFLQIGKSPTFDMGAMNEKELTLDEMQNDSDDQEEERLKVIAEAFEDEDLLEEFRKRKQEEVESQLPKVVDTTLPGWGEWGGRDLKPNKKKRKMFTLGAPPPPPRQDARVSHVILNESANSKLRDHQVRTLPFPFKRVQDFEKMIRAPVGRTWLPEQAMKSLTAPKIITRLGAAIQPISEDVLVSKAELATKKPQLTGLKLLPVVARRKSAKHK